MRNLEIKIDKKKQLKRKLSEIDLIQLQKEIQEIIPGVAGMTICSEYDIITEIQLHQTDDITLMKVSGDEKPQREKDIQSICEMVDKHVKAETMETVSEALQRSKGRNINERMDNIEHILSQLPENLKIKKVE